MWKSLSNLLKGEFYKESWDSEIYAKSLVYMFFISIWISGFFQILLFKKFDIPLYFFDINELVNTWIIFFVLFLPFLLSIKKAFGYNYFINIIMILVLTILTISNLWVLIILFIVSILSLSFLYVKFQNNLQKVNTPLIFVYIIIIGIFIFIPNMKWYYYDALNLDYSICLKEWSFKLDNSWTNDLNNYKKDCHEVKFFNHKYILTVNDEIINNSDTIYLLKTKYLLNR